MSSSGAPAVRWVAVAQFHREVACCAGEALFALPVTVSATERWSSLTGFEPEQLAGPWEVDIEALASPHLQRELQNGMVEAFIGGPCWLRWMSEDEQAQRLEWIPLIYRRVSIETNDHRLHIDPADNGWTVCPLMSRFLGQNNVQTVAPLDEILPDLLPVAEAKAANDGNGMTRALIDAFQLAVPEVGELLIQARDRFPAERAEFVPSPWVLLTHSAKERATMQHVLREYDWLERRLTADPHHIGGLGLLQNSAGATVPATPEVTPIIPLNDSQHSALEAALAGRPITVIRAPGGRGKNEVVLSILLNAWASGTSVVFASHSNQVMDAVNQRLKALESEFDIAIDAGTSRSENIDESLGRTLDLLEARRGETYYGGSPSARKRTQLARKKQQIRELIDNQVPQRVSEAIKSAIESHVAQHKAHSVLESRREELTAGLHDLGIEDDPDSFLDHVIEPLRKWREGIDATRRLIAEDAQRNASLAKELSTARSERDSALADYQIETRADQESSWLLTEPGFRSFEQAVAVLTDKLKEPIENGSADESWEKAYDAWPSSEAATEWERKARELASLIRPAGIALKEKVEEVRAAERALDETKRNVQDATKSATLDVRRDDLDEWAACYEEVCALPRSKLGFLPQTKNGELVERLETMERRFRSSFPAHVWTSIGKLDESGRARLSTVVERAREWVRARDDWDRLGPVREEIEAETDALRRKLVDLGERSLSIELSPATCASIASKVNEKASLATTAAAAWSKREARERLPAELANLAAQIRVAAVDAPIKERWANGAGAPLMAALGALEADPGLKTITAVRNAFGASTETESVLKFWRRAYEAEKQAVAIAEEMERIPSRAARLTHWASRQPASLPESLDVADAFEGDETHPVWAFLEKCEAWSNGWTSFRSEEAPALEQTVDVEGARAAQRIGEAAKFLPPGKARTWLEGFASGSMPGVPWPIDDITEKAALWRPQRLQAEIEKIDAQLERITFETAREQWLERVARDAEVLQSLDALRNHYRHNPQGIEEDAYPHFKRTLKAQPVWTTKAMSTQLIPMQPGLFDLLVIDEGTQCTLTEVLPLLFRAKRLVVIGDPEQSMSIETLGVEAERALAAQLGVEEWLRLLGHVGNDIYKTAVSTLPRRQADVLSLTESNETRAPNVAGT